MILNSRNNLFNFKFPRHFIPAEVADKYKKYLNRMPGNIIEETYRLYKLFDTRCCIAWN